MLSGIEFFAFPRLVEGIKSLGSYVSSYYSCTRPEVDVAAVQSSWKGIKDSLGDKAPEIVGKLLFENLFTDYPEILNYFKSYGSSSDEVVNNAKFMWHAKNRVFVTFDKIINSLEDQAEIDNISAWLAKSHAPKGITPADFLNLGNTILKTLGQALGDKFTPELKSSWSSLLVSLFTSMGNKLRS